MTRWLNISCDAYVKKYFLLFILLLGYFPAARVNAQLPLDSAQQNYNSCLHGYYGCDQSKLTDTQRLEVRHAASRRNYKVCLHGYYGCDQSKLTDIEKVEVQQASDQRNLSACLHGYPICDQSRLTAAQKESLVKSAQSTPDKPTNPPRYYTNGAGERVQSPTYSATVPDGATAQCRDGTYSFSRNHRGTCSHHGGVSKWLD